MGLWEEGATMEAMTMRYKRFGGLSLGVVPRSEWHRFLPDLLPFEEGFWYG